MKLHYKNECIILLSNTCVLFLQGLQRIRVVRLAIVVCDLTLYDTALCNIIDILFTAYSMRLVGKELFLVILCIVVPVILSSVPVILSNVPVLLSSVPVILSSVPVILNKVLIILSSVSIVPVYQLHRAVHRIY